MKRLRESLEAIYSVEDETQTIASVIQPKDEQTRKFLESLNKREPEKPLKCMYYKMRNGEIVEGVWRPE